MAEEFKPKVDTSKSESVKSAMKRQAQVNKGKKKLAEAARADAPAPRANPIVADETYGGLREANRVVMRHTIALNIADFKAATEEFAVRPERTYAPLADAAPPFFSVVIANYNGERHLRTCLDALRCQTFTDFEVIVADDASNDGSLTLVETEYPEVRLVITRQNLGFAAICNTGASASSGRYIVMLNNDTEPDAEWLAELARVIVANPQAASVASKLLLFDERNRLHTAGDALRMDGTPRNRGAWQVDDGRYDDGAEVFSACGGAAAYRRDVWEALGGFDEEFWMYMEDVDFGFRARLAGFDAALAPEAKVYHHVSASGGDVLASYYVGRNAIWLIAKNMPDALLRRNLPWIVLAQVMIAIDALRNWRGKAARERLRGQWDGLRTLPGQLAKRREIQKNRAVDESAIARALVRE